MAPLVETRAEARRVSAWRCRGCGRVEAPQPCIGVCSDQRVELVDAQDYETALAQLKRLEVEHERLVQFIRMVARNKPHEDCWEKSYRHLQELAEEALTP